MKQRAHPFPSARLVIAIACSAVLATLFVACSDDDDGTATTGSTTAAPTSTPGGTTSAPEPIGADASLVYFSRGEHLAAAGRETPEGASALEPALRAVLSGPSAFERDDADLDSSVPEGSTLHRATITGSLATVDLSSEFETGGGSLSMRMRVAQIVYTATEIAGVERVTITIDGESVSGLGGEGVDVEAVDRSAFDDLLPPILVQRPVPGQRIERELEVSGLANVFEGTVSIEVLDADGEIVARGFGTGAMGEWRPYEATLTIPAEVEGEVTVRCYEESAENGSRLHVVEVPVTLAA